MLTIGVVSDQPVAGAGTVTVRVTGADGATVSFKLEDAAGTISATRTVADGGPADQAALDGVIETTLDLKTLFENTPESGTAIVYAGTGDGFSVPQQGFSAKRQITIDADAPTAAVTDGASARPGQQVKIDYSITDVPQKVRSATMKIVAPDGSVAKTVTGLQTGENNAAQFVVPSDLRAGTYDVTLVVVDEVSHRVTDTLEKGLVVKPGTGPGGNPGKSSSAPVGALEIVSEQPVAGTGTVAVTVSGAETVSFKIEDAAGTVSATKTVTDGGPADLAATSGVVDTTLDLKALFENPPESGTAVLYAGSGDGFSIPRQTFDAKTQVEIDADAPTAKLVDGGSAKPGKQAQVTYTVTDVPQKVDSITLQIVGPDGNRYKSVSGLQVGRERTAQFRVPSALSAGEYDLKLVAVDEVGYRTTDTLQGGLVVKSGGGSTVPASDLSVLDDQPIPGSGTVTVRVSAGSTVSFKIQDAAGTVSATRTVADGGPADRTATGGVVETELDLSRLFENPPESGTAKICAASGDGFSIPQQTFDTKTQATIDADAPTAAVTEGTSAKAGDQVKVGYSVTDRPQKVDSITLTLVGPDGLVYDRIEDLQAGEGSAAQFIVPKYARPGTYDLKLAVVDEVGHRVTDTLRGGLVVKPGGGGDGSEEGGAVTASALEIVSQQPVKGSGAVAVRASVSAVGANVTFVVRDAAGSVSATRTVTDGGPADRAAGRAAVVQTDLDLRTLFDDAPGSGTGVVYAAAGDDLSVGKQTFDTKRQVAIDADAPTATVVSGGSTEPGQQVKVTYTVADRPQKVSSVTLKVVAPNGDVVETISGLQAGEDRAAQFVVPWDTNPGKYDLTLVAVDEVGNRVTDTLEEGLVVRERTVG